MYAKFYKMLKVGVPIHVVKAKMAAEKLDGSIIDKPGDEMIPLNSNEEAAPTADVSDALRKGLAAGILGSKGNTPNAKSLTPTVRKKKLYWKALDAR